MSALGYASPVGGVENSGESSDVAEDSSALMQNADIKAASFGEEEYNAVKSALDQTRQELTEAKKNLEDARSVIEHQENDRNNVIGRNQRAEKENRQLRASIGKMSESHKGAIRNRDETIQELKQRKGWRWATFILAGLLVVGFPFAFLFGLLSAKAPRIEVSQNTFKCPKCHWDLPSGTKVCPNPECATRFS